MNDQDRTTFDCTDIRAQLSGLLDDRLSAADRYRAERHLAGCKACRDLVSEAELNDAMVAADASAAGALPEGFEAAVLGRTVYEGRGRLGRRLTAVLGWVAAAASLGLALSLWSVNRSGPEGAGRVFQTILGYESGPELRSWTLEAPVNEAPPPVVLGAPVSTYPVARTRPEPLRAAAAPGPHGAAGSMTREDAEALETTTNLLAMLQQGDDRSFADVEFVRRITEYDNLLTRLATIRRDLPAERRLAVLAAESVLYRVVTGPLSQDDVRELRHAIDTLDLPAQIGAAREKASETAERSSV